MHNAQLLTKAPRFYIMGFMEKNTGQSPLPVHTVEILVVADNYADTMLASTPGVRRPPMGVDGRLPKDTLLAEHGLGLLITAEKNDRRARILLDAGYTSVEAPRNLRQLDNMK